MTCQSSHFDITVLLLSSVSIVASHVFCGVTKPHGPRHPFSSAANTCQNACLSAKAGNSGHGKATQLAAVGVCGFVLAVLGECVSPT